MIRSLLRTRRGASALTTVLTGAWALACTATADSNLKTDEPPLAFESVIRNVEIGYYPREIFVDFLFEARGPGAVSIRNSSSTCPCTTVATERTVYYPGQKGVVAVIYSYRGDPAPEVQVVRVLTDRAPRPQLLQVVPRRSARGLWVERHELHWAGAPTRLAQQIEVEVAPEFLGRIPIVELAATGWHAAVESVEPAGRYRVTIQPTIDQPPAAQAVLKLAPSSNSGVGSTPSPQVEIELFPASPAPPAAPSPAS